MGTLMAKMELDAVITCPQCGFAYIEQRRIVVYLDGLQPRLASHKGMISSKILCSPGLRGWSSRASALLARIETQSQTGEELRPLFGRMLLPSVLDRAFKGEWRQKHWRYV